MTANRSLFFVALAALFAVLMAIGCDGWDGLVARKKPTNTRRVPKAPVTPEGEVAGVTVENPALKKALQVEADLTRVASAGEALQKIVKEIDDDAPLAPELTPQLIAYARLADKLNLALEKAKPFVEEHADDYERLLRVTQAIVEPAAFLGLDKPSDAIARDKDGGALAWAKTEPGKKLAKIAVQSAEKGRKVLLEEGDSELFEHLFDQLHVRTLLAEAHRAAGHRQKAIKTIEETLEATRRPREEIRAAVDELRGLKRQLAAGNFASDESTDSEAADGDEE